MGLKGKINKISFLQSRTRLCDNVVFFAITLFLIDDIALQGTLLPYKYNNISSFNFRFTLLLRAIIVVFALIRNRAYKKNDMLQLIVFMVLSVLSYYFVKSTAVFDLFFLTYLFPSIDKKRFVNVFFHAILLSTILVIVMYFLNVFPEYVIYRNDTEMRRYSFGFSHPNVLGRILMLLCMLYVIKVEGKVKIKDIFVIFCVGLFIYLLPNSVTAAEIIFLLALILLIRYINGSGVFKSISIEKLIRLASKIVFPLLFVLSVAITNNSELQEALRTYSVTFYKRFYYGMLAIEQYGIHLFGSNISFMGSTQRYFSDTTESVFVIDCLYVLLIVKYGMVISAYYVMNYIKAVKCCIRANKDYMLIILILVAVYSLAENGMTLFYTSFIFVCSICKDTRQNDSYDYYGRQICE